MNILDWKLIKSRIKEWSRVAMETKKRRMDWVLVSRDWLSDQDQVVDEEAVLCFWDLRKLHYSFGLHSPVVFCVFLD